MSDELRQHILRAMQVLVIFAIIGGGLVALGYHITIGQIAANERAAMLASLQELVPTEMHDNDIFTDTSTVQHPTLLGTSDAVTVYHARQGNQTVAIIFNAIAPNGYGGKIRLLLGVKVDGSLLGVRVVSHKETPGLGDAIETRRSDWIHQFVGKSLHNPQVKGWAVRRDGGQFDQFSGATITPRAVVQAVHKALNFVQAHNAQLFAPSNLRIIDATSHTGTIQ